MDLECDTSTLWFAGKQLQPEKKLIDYLGRNENTRAVVKLQKKGSGPPAREPVSQLLCVAVLVAAAVSLAMILLDTLTAAVYRI